MNFRNPHCELCPLSHDAETVCMNGWGKSDSRIMIVGEAPGAQEDRAGVPFIGPAGTLLKQMLKTARIPRNECYITNVAKCRPPANRTPSIAEAKTCVGAYFWQELGEVRPEFILLLGNAALKGVMKKSGITKQRGQAWNKEFAIPDGTHSCMVFAAFHPAYVLRNAANREPLEADLARFGRMVRGDRETAPKTLIRLVKSPRALAALRNHASKAKEVSFDIETYCDHPLALQCDKPSFQDYRGNDYSHISSLAVTTSEGESVVAPLWHKENQFQETTTLDDLRKAFESDARYVGHNAKFDVRWLRRKGIDAHLTFDTMLAAHILDENRLKGLKPLSQIVLDADAYAVGDELENAPEMPLAELATYNGKDSDYTLRLYHILKEELKKDPKALRIFLLLLMPASNALVDIELRGVRLDMKLLSERMGMLTRNMEKLRRYMVKYVPPDKKDKFNPGSHPQVQSWVFNDLGFQPIKKSKKTGNPSTDKDVLSQIKDQHPALEALSKWRKCQKWMGYLNSWARYQQDGTIYPTYKPAGTVTGRLSCTDPNLQQVPREDFMRSIICAHKGWKLMLADYSQLELRIAAMLADERRMLRLFLTGHDIHTYMAGQITGKLESDVEKIERYRAKVANFGFLYDMGYEKFVHYARMEYDVIFTEEEAKEVKAKYFRSFPALKPWHDRQRRLVKRYGQVSSPIGRVRHLPDIYSDDDGVKANAERQAINHPVQSLGTDAMLESLIHLNSTLDPNECRIIMSVHDSLGFEVRDGLEDEYGPYVKKEMEDRSRIKRKFGFEITVPLVVDVEVNTHWRGA